MKTTHGLLMALTALKPTPNQLALVTAFYTDAHNLRFFIETHGEKGCPYYSVANDHCGITVKLLLDNCEAAQTIPADALMLTPEDSQKLREFIQEDIDGLVYFHAIVKTLNACPIETVTKWITTAGQCTTLHFGVDGKVMIQIELDAAQALSAAPPEKALTWPFSAETKKATAYFLPKHLRMLPEEVAA